jgi:hypothetical protein
VASTREASQTVNFRCAVVVVGEVEIANGVIYSFETDGRCEGCGCFRGNNVAPNGLSCAVWKKEEEEEGRGRGQQRWFQGHVTG